MTLAAALRDPELFGAHFRPPESWRAWVAVAKALFGEPLTPDEAEVFARLAGGRPAPTAPVRELLILAGRRSGKSRFSAALAVWLAVAVDYLERLAPGERAVIFVLAVNRLQARVVFSYIRGLLESTPMLAGLVVNVTTETIELSNGVSIEVAAADYRSIRGRSLAACIVDEACFLPVDPEAASPDTALVAAVKPALVTLGGLLIGISSPHMRSGWAWETYRRAYGQPDARTLVLQSDSRTLNPSLDEEEVARAYAEDPAVAAAEWGGEWRSDLERFLSVEVVDRAIEPRGDHEPVAGVQYTAFADPSGGQGDRFALAIGHLDGETVVVDVVRHRTPPFVLEAVVEEYAALLKRYGVHVVEGDRYAAAWCAQTWLKAGVVYDSEIPPKSALYVASLPVFMASRVTLPDDRLLRAELLALERRTRSGAADVVDHPRGARDDAANAVCGLVARLAGPGLPVPVRELGWLGPERVVPRDWHTTGPGVPGLSVPGGRWRTYSAGATHNPHVQE